MNMNDIKNTLSNLKSNTLLVCEWDGFTLNAAAFNKVGKSLEVIARAESDKLDPELAFAEVLASVQTQGWKGNRLIVLTPSVLSTLIELPVPANKPKPIEQMHELVKWEVEPLLMQHQLQWTLGQLMESRGMLSNEQVAEINTIQKEKSQGATKFERQPLKRFGEIALELGYVTKQEAQSLFVVQDWLRGDDDHIQCSWVAQGEVEDVTGVWHWLVTATHQSILTKWYELAEENALTLLGVMPLTGNSVALLDEFNKNNVLLESTRLMSTAAVLKHNKVVAVHHHVQGNASLLDASLEVYHASPISKSPAVYVAAPEQEIESLISPLSEALNISPNPVITNIRNVSPGVVAVAKFYFKQAGKGLLCLMRPEGPVPAPWLRLEVQGALLVGILLLIIAVSELSLNLNYQGIVTEKTEIDERFEVLNEAVSRINRQQAEIDKRKQELIEQQQDQQRMQARLTFFGQTLPERSLMVQAILGILQNTVSDQIIINRIDEMGRRVGISPPVTPLNRPGVIETDNFNIDAWALTESAAQQFVQNMKLAVASWEMEVRDIQVFEKDGPMNMPGYSVSLSLVRVVLEQESVQGVS